jgi:LacI family transcriptional regulator
VSRSTIRDVARTAGVSVGTVSHVLSGSRTVRPATRARVEAAIAALHYRPSTIARALNRRRTQTIGMVVPDVANPFFADLIREVEQAMADLDHAVVFGNSANDPERERRYLESFLSRRVDAAIVAVTAGSDLDLLRHVAAEVPTVLVDRPVPVPADTVVGDNRGGLGLAVEHLVSLGHRRVGYLDGDPALGTARERRAGLEEALARHGLEPAAASDGAFTLASGHEQALALLRAAGRPSAVCAGNDLLAMGLLKAAGELGVAVPEDMAVVGYDDIVYAAFTSPPLTTVRQPGRAMGEATARLLEARLRGETGPPRAVTIEPELVVRASTAPPPEAR